MSLVVLEDICLAYGKKTILDGFGLRIAEADRIGLVGANGSGKTSLLRLISNTTVPDRGVVRCAKDVRVGYLPQDIAIESQDTLENFVLRSVPGRDALGAALEAAEKRLEDCSRKEDVEGTMEVATELADLHEQK
ncbi:MAG: ABC-F family ATP-binding cassette domain-containing protein, partial [Myxococcales bacterium]|nr:ABC-F family ATP-binding cassette domain-containing protein [Myxococcales bacterium]